MINDEDAKQMFLDAKTILDEHGYDRKFANQLYRGSCGPYNWENKPPGGCKRHMTIFREFNVVPEFCFDCYKVVIEPRTVIELFKLVLIFLNHKLPNDNVRKCMAEGREKVSGMYKGMIYCLGLEEGNKILETFQELIAEEISDKVPITLKRGCSEYAHSYPEYTRVSQGSIFMDYMDEWKQYENIVDKKMVINRPPDPNATYNHAAYSLRDAEAMYAWLRYAATIGDLSYLKISDSTLEPYQNLKRPSAFQPVEE